MVLTHEELPDRQMKSDAFRYVSGIPEAVERAKELAGDQDVLVMGGSNIAQQFLNAGLIDEIRLSIAHILLGDGVRLFDELKVAPRSRDGVVGVELIGDASGAAYSSLAEQPVDHPAEQSRAGPS